ncbi:hypothetical protein E4U39_007377 [Claviceps sp. Clav50 group G5]|nr:hypothetical protein E4U39_007377 [Claviceps sp. Clav50 group G5]
MDSPASSEQTNMVIRSVISSGSYSPTALGHLRRPVPNDLPPELDAKVFTFQDAFEDLLVASKGQDLPDIRSRHQQRQLLWNMFPTGEPTWFWLRRLESQGLVRPVDPFAFITMHNPMWPTVFEEESHPKNIDLWGSGQTDDNSGYGTTNIGLFERMKRALAEMERGIFGNSSRTGDAQHRGLANLDELLSEVSSRFRDSQSSWDAFFKSVFHTENSDLRDKSQGPLTHRGKQEVVTTEKEHVDRFGYLHKTVTRKMLDAEGKEVGVETYVTVRPAGEHVNKTDDEGSNQ